MRTLAIGLLLTAVGGLLLGADADRAGASAGDDAAAEHPPVHVLQVDGLFDDIVVASITDAIDDADEAGAQALILQVNTRGAVVDDHTMEALLTDVDAAPLPVAVWVGPSGSRLYGKPAQLLAVAAVSGMAPGARVGHTGAALQPDGVTVDFGEATAELRNASLGLTEARTLGVFDQRVSDEGIATLRNMVDNLDGYEHDGTVLHTTIEVVDDGTVQRETVASVVMTKLSLTDQIFHSVASPSMAYLLLLIGMALLVFEFYTAGVGVAGVVGAGSLALATTGLVALPTRWWAVGLLAAAMVAFAIDVQVGIPRFWTAIGVLATVAGSFRLFAPLPSTELRPSWLALVAGIGGVVVVFTAGMPSMVRTRFATPTIGRDWMIGELGTAVEAVSPDGVVAVGEGQWRARTNRATPVAAGGQVRVVSIDGATLEVEPLEGAAKDYRERRRSGETTGS